MLKNVANQFIAVHLVDSAGDDVSAGTTNVFFTGDNGTRTPAGTATNKGGGTWVADTGVEGNTNFNHIAWTFENAGAVNVTINVYPTSINPDNSYALESSVNDVQSRLPAALVSGKMDSDAVAVAGNTQAATRLASGANQLRDFVVGASPTSTSIPTDITGTPFTNANHYIDRVVTINEETQKITASSGSPVVLTTTAFVSVPAQNDEGSIS